MAISYTSVVPWGRNLAEYKAMFALSNDDLGKSIISFGDGPASFNSEMTWNKRKVISIDPIYAFSKDKLKQRIADTKDQVAGQVKNNMEKFVWTSIKSPDDLYATRMASMNAFLDDLEQGREEGRYIAHELPAPCPFADNSFSLGLSSHFLLLYTQLGLDFHIRSVQEMLRLCPEIRIFPLLDLNAEPSPFLDPLMEAFRDRCAIEIRRVDYEFQKNGNKMLVMVRNIINKGKKTNFV